MQSLRQNLKTTHKVELEANHYAKKIDLKHKMNNLENIHRNNTEGESWR